MYVLAEECSPELRMLAWEIQRDRQRQSVDRLQKYPDLEMGVNYSIITDDDSALRPVANGQDNFNFTVGTTLPGTIESLRGCVKRPIALAARPSDWKLSVIPFKAGCGVLMAQADGLVQQQEIYNSRIIPRTEDSAPVLRLALRAQ